MDLTFSENESGLPYDGATEMRVLGSLMRDDAYMNSVDELSYDLFASRRHQAIYFAIGTLVNDSVNLSVGAIEAHLRKENTLAEVGGREYLYKVWGSATVDASLPYYLKLLKEYAARRKAIILGRKLINGAQDTSSKIDDILAELQSEAIDIQAQTTIDTPKKIAEAMRMAKESMDKRVSEQSTGGVLTKHKDLDAMVNGFQPGELVIIGARPGMGKTAFILQSAYEVARSGMAVAFYSLEMSTEQLAQRLISNLTEIDHDTVVKSWNLGAGDHNRIEDAIEASSDIPLYVQECPGLTPEGLYARAKKLQIQEKNLGMVIIDHATRMNTLNRKQDSYQKYTEISRGCKDLALRLGIPVVALVQLNRGLEGRDDKRPQLKDLRDTGAWEEDADKVLFLYRDDYYYKNSSKTGEVEVIVSKNRSGSKGTIELLFKKECVRFFDREKRRYA